MTDVVFRITRPSSTGTLFGVEGSIHAVPTSKRVIVGTPDAIVLPIGFTKRLESGNATISLIPTGPDWAWAITLTVAGHKQDTEYFAVPATGPVDFPELQHVDASNFLPLPERVINGDGSGGGVGGAWTKDPSYPGLYILPAGTVVDSNGTVSTGS